MTAPRMTSVLAILRQITPTNSQGVPGQVARDKWPGMGVPGWVAWDGWFIGDPSVVCQWSVGGPSVVRQWHTYFELGIERHMTTYHSVPHSMDSERSFYTFQQSFSLSPSTLERRLLGDLIDPETVSYLVEVTILWNMSVK